MTVAVLDTDPDYRQVITVICRRLDLHAECVESLEDLLRRAEDENDSLVIGDAGDLHGTAGVVALRRRTMAPPLIVLDTGGRAEEYLEAGADYHLSKPFAPSLLRTTALAAMRRATALAPITQSRRLLGGVVFEPGRRRLGGLHGRISLTAREADLLEFLAVNSGRVVTRTQILDGAWGGVAEATDAAVVSGVYRLRRKLFQAGVAVQIATEPGLGYRLRLDAADDGALTDHSSWALVGT